MELNSYEFGGKRMKLVLTGRFSFAILLDPPSKEEVKSQLRTGISLPIAIGTILTLALKKKKLQTSVREEGQKEIEPENDLIFL